MEKIYYIVQARLLTNVFLPTQLINWLLDYAGACLNVEKTPHDSIIL